MVTAFYYIILKPLSKLPLGALYLLADLLYLIVYRILAYRKGVVQDNINNAFPNKTEEERTKIIKDFYRFFTNLMVETIWTFSLTEQRVRKRFHVENPQVLDEYYAANKGVIVILAHYSCWELVLSSLNLFVKHQVETIYIPLSNPAFDKYYLRMRTIFGSKMVSKKDFKNSFEKATSFRAIIFGADQSPAISKNIYWTQFLNQDTAVAMGAESYAKKYDMPVVYAHLNSARRGYFKLTFKTVADDPKGTEDGEISELHVRMLEKQIVAKPSDWLWSHKRWKKKREQTA